MRITGRLHRITNLTAFAASYLSTNGNPTTGFANFRRVRVYVATDAPLKSFNSSFVPNFSYKSDSDNNGTFSVDVPDGLKGFQGRVLVYEATTVNVNLPGVPAVEILVPLYRSAPFALSKVTAAEKHIFLLETVTADEQGIPQSELKKEAGKLKKKLKLDKISLSIVSDGVNATAEKKGGTIKFKITPRASTGPDLQELVRLKVDDVDIDLPGPDFIAGLCVSKADIEKQVRNGVAGFADTLNDEIRAAIDAQAPGITSLASFTISRIRYPITSTQTVNIPVIGPQTFSQRSVVLDPTAGVPVQLY